MFLELLKLQVMHEEDTTLWKASEVGRTGTRLELVALLRGGYFLLAS